MNCTLKKYLLPLITVIFSSLYCYGQTELDPGDVAILGLDANTNACSGVTSEDEISFVCFKDIAPGTTLDITDNGWERLLPGFWGDSEGTIRLTRTGAVINAGTVITITLNNSAYTGISPDNDWTITSINGGTKVNMNSNGDQIYFMQGGTWDNGGDGIGQQNASYVNGTILFGFNTKTTWAADGTTQQSNLYPGLECFSMEPSGGTTDFIKYTGLLTPTDQKSWINRINDPSNWTSFANCTDYNSTAPDFASGYVIPITSFFDVEAGNDSTVCEAGGLFDLLGTPPGGMWSGTGVSGNFFDATSSGTGDHLVTFTYDDAGCLYTDTKIISVNADADPSWTQPDTTCPLAGVINLDALITGTIGGTWSGSGVSGSSFDPSAVLGAIPVTYSVQVTPCPIRTQENDIVVNPDPDASWTTFSSICEASSPINLSTLITGDPGGVWSGSGVSGNSFNPSGLSGNIDITYTVGSNPCISIVTHTITVYTNPVAITLATTPEVCANDSMVLDPLTIPGTGTITTFLWSNETSPLLDVNSSTPIFTTGISGTYSLDLTVTDDLGCSNTGSIQVIVNDLPSVSLSLSTDISCNGLSDGSIDINVSGGSTPYSFSWDNSATTEDISAVPAGNYSVITTDDNGCKDTLDIVLTEPGLLLTTVSGQDALCFGGLSGSAYVIPSGGTSPFSFLWDNTETVDSITGLTAGNYYVTVTDNHSCTAIDSIQISEPTILQLSFSEGLPTCHGYSDGNLAANVSGGISPYSYLWEGGESDIALTNIPYGTYSVTVTDNNNCTLNDTYNVGQPDSLTIQFSPTNVRCFEGTDGLILTAVSGGTSPYSYLWTTTETTDSIANLVPGTYYLTVTDNNSCETIDSVIISEPTEVISNIEIIAHPSCFGYSNGQVQVNVSGGISPYGFIWSNGLTDQLLDTLIAGTYYCSISDFNNCVSVQEVTLIEPSLLTTTLSKQDISCYSLCDGEAIVQASGGTLPYNYLWASVANDTITELCPGEYFVTTSDAMGCSTIDSVDIFSPDSLQLISLVTNVDCYGMTTGNIDLSVTGGVTPISYQWSSGQTTEDISGLESATYSISLFDDNGCTIQDTFYVTQPDSLVVQLSAIDAHCGNSDGSASSIVTGGTTPYSYQWSNGTSDSDIQLVTAGNYSLTLSDNNNCTAVSNIMINNISTLSASIESSSNPSCYGYCNGYIKAVATMGTMPYTYIWSSTETVDSIYNICAGNYSLTVTDSEGCNAYSSIVIDEPDSLQINFTINPEDCNEADGAMTASVSGGTSPYSFLWNTDNTNPFIDSITAGNYSVTVADYNGCSVIDSGEVSQSIPGYSIIADTTTFSNVSCYSLCDGIVTLQGTGSSGSYGNYMYTWSNGSTTATAENLCPGIYSYTIADRCKNVNGSIEISEPIELSAVLSKTNIECFGNAQGSASASVSGGVSPYGFSWSTGSSSQIIYNLEAGNYSITITDANNCETVENTVITEPDSIIITMNITDEHCGNSDGTASATITGGVSPYSYEWSNTQTQSSISGLDDGNYGLTINDANNCQASTSFIINPSEFISSVVVFQNDLSCFGICDGDISVLGTNGTPPYSYAWTSGETTQYVSGLCDGNYSYTITDVTGCYVTGTISLNQPSSLELSLTSEDIDCFGHTTGSISSEVSGGTTPYSYSWSNGLTYSDIATLGKGEFTVTVSDANGCTKTSGKIIAEPEELEINPYMTLPSCRDNNDGEIVITIAGGTIPYTQIWENGETGLIRKNLSAGTYTVTVTDNNNCQSSGYVTYANPDNSCFDELLIPDAISPNNDGQNDTWKIRGIEQFSSVKIEIFNRWGNSVFTFEGNGLSYLETLNQWNGMHNDRELPSGSYVYIVEITETEDVFKGIVSIMR